MCAVFCALSQNNTRVPGPAPGKEQRQRIKINISQFQYYSSATRVFIGVGSCSRVLYFTLTLLYYCSSFLRSPCATSTQVLDQFIISIPYVSYGVTRHKLSNVIFSVYLRGWGVFIFSLLALLYRTIAHTIYLFLSVC